MWRRKGKGERMTWRKGDERRCPSDAGDVRKVATEAKAGKEEEEKEEEDKKEEKQDEEEEQEEGGFGGGGLRETMREIASSGHLAIRSTAPDVPSFRFVIPRQNQKVFASHCLGSRTTMPALLFVEHFCARCQVLLSISFFLLALEVIPSPFESLTPRLLSPFEHFSSRQGESPWGCG